MARLPSPGTLWRIYSSIGISLARIRLLNNTSLAAVRRCAEGASKRRGVAPASRVAGDGMRHQNELRNRFMLPAVLGVAAAALALFPATWFLCDQTTGLFYPQRAGVCALAIV